MKHVLIIAAVIVTAAAAVVIISERSHDHDGHDSTHGEEHTTLEAKEPVRADGSFTITTSFYPLAFALEQIVGENAQVTNIGAGRDPHDFRPSTQDIATLQQSDLVVLQGAEFEPWGDRIQEQLKSEDVPVLIATAELTLREGGEHEHHDDDADHDEADHSKEESAHVHEEGETHNEAHDDHEHGAYDPHTWVDPVLFAETVGHLTEGLVTIDPENAAIYEANAEILLSELATLNTAYETTLATCALDEVITSHEAFGYVGERYGFTIHTIAGISTQDQPSTQTLAALRAEAAEGVGAILLEENSVTAYGETLATETGLQTLSINPIAYVIPEGEDYFTLMRANLDTFKTALNCNG